VGTIGAVLATTTIESEGRLDEGDIVPIVLVAVVLLVVLVVVVVLSRKGYFGDGSDAE
jgi:hypothetical protein